MRRPFAGPAFAAPGARLRRDRIRTRSEAVAAGARRAEGVRRAALRIALFYVLVAAAWIYLSDMVLIIAMPDHLVSRLNTIKGIVFVLITGILLFGLIRRSFSREIALQDSRAETQHRWRELVEHTTDAIVVLDGRRIVYANNVAAKLIGGTETGKLVGRDLDASLITGNLGRVERRIGHIAQGGELPSRPFRIQRLDGSERTIEALLCDTVRDIPGEPNRARFHVWRRAFFFAPSPCWTYLLPNPKYRTDRS